MDFDALAVDYDGTLATDGRVTPEAVEALERFRASGRRLLLVTGRELGPLRLACPRLGLFDRVVAENGGLLYDPSSGAETPLGPSPPVAFLERLAALGVAPLSVGRVVVATWRPHEVAVARAIEELGLDLEVVRNKRAVMVLPRGVDKASGLAAAVGGLGLALSSTVAVGDAENDLAFLGAAGLAVAVGNALPEVKARADLVTMAAHGAGVVELIERWLGGRRLRAGGGAG